MLKRRSRREYLNIQRAASMRLVCNRRQVKPHRQFYPLSSDLEVNNWMVRVAEIAKDIAHARSSSHIAQSDIQRAVWQSFKRQRPNILVFRRVIHQYVTLAGPSDHPDPSNSSTETTTTVTPAANTPLEEPRYDGDEYDDNRLAPENSAVIEQQSVHAQRAESTKERPKKVKSRRIIPQSAGLPVFVNLSQLKKNLLYRGRPYYYLGNPNRRRRRPPPPPRIALSRPIPQGCGYDLCPRGDRADESQAESKIRLGSLGKAKQNAEEEFEDAWLTDDEPHLNCSTREASRSFSKELTHRLAERPAKRSLRRLQKYTRKQTQNTLQRRLYKFSRNQPLSSLSVLPSSEPALTSLSCPCVSPTTSSTPSNSSAELQQQSFISQPSFSDFQPCSSRDGSIDSREIIVRPRDTGHSSTSSSSSTFENRRHFCEEPFGKADSCSQQVTKKGNSPEQKEPVAIKGCVKKETAMATDQENLVSPKVDLTDEVRKANQISLTQATHPAELSSGTLGQKREGDHVFSHRDMLTAERQQQPLSNAEQSDDDSRLVAARQYQTEEGDCVPPEGEVQTELRPQQYKQEEGASTLSFSTHKTSQTDLQVEVDQSQVGGRGSQAAVPQVKKCWNSGDEKAERVSKGNSKRLSTDAERSLKRIKLSEELPLHSNIQPTAGVESGPKNEVHPTLKN
ncbi:adapter protein unc-53-like isoform X2 [Varroa destructor]|uniref:Uncharacterized protein n=1 Tax=Varroa destructor TaxID=109461 RepID=A0A7M7K1W7_VARDE|nr:adapter protein unc-53-like isoform X2 [Varroa destructor]